MLLEFISNAKLLVNTLGYKISDTIEDSSVKQKDDQILFIFKPLAESTQRESLLRMDLPF